MILARFVVLCLISFLVEINCQSSKPPGAQIQLSQSGLNYAGRVAVDILEKNLQKQKIQDFTGKKKVLFNNVEYYITNINIKSFTKPTSTVTVNTGTGFTWTLSNAAISLTGDWRYKYKIIFVNVRDSGTFEVTVTGASATVSATLGKLSNGNPTIRMLSCSCHVDKVNVKFRGGASWLYNLFSGFVERPLREALEKEVCKGAEKTINTNAAAQLATFKTRVTLEQRFVIDYSLTSNPEFKNGYMQTSHRGEVFYASDSSSAPFSGPQISPLPPTRMATAYVTEYVANTLGYVLFRNNILSYNVTKEDLPENVRPYLLTSCTTGTCFGTLFPRAAELYPDSSVELQLTTTESPTMTITSQSVIGTIKGRAKIVVRALSSGATGNIISLGVTLTIAVSPSVRGNTIVATATQINPTISIESSDIGSFPADKANELIAVAANGFILPKLNEVGQKGLDIPNVDKVTFVGPAISLTNGALVLATDVSYTP